MRGSLRSARGSRRGSPCRPRAGDRPQPSVRARRSRAAAGTSLLRTQHAVLLVSTATRLPSRTSRRAPTCVRISTPLAAAAMPSACTNRSGSTCASHVGMPAPTVRPELGLEAGRVLALERPVGETRGWASRRPARAPPTHVRVEDAAALKARCRAARRGGCGARGLWESARMTGISPLHAAPPRGSERATGAAAGQPG